MLLSTSVSFFIQPIHPSSPPLPFPSLFLLNCVELRCSGLAGSMVMSLSQVWQVSSKHLLSKNFNSFQHITVSRNFHVSYILLAQGDTFWKCLKSSGISTRVPQQEAKVQTNGSALFSEVL